jgi:[protein-PII] uridylyltransferase
LVLPLFFDERRFLENLRKGNSIEVFRDAISAINIQFHNRFREGEDIRSLVNERASFMDRILHHAWHLHEWGENVALLAVGGYGRAELHPHSDIDLLVLYDLQLAETDKENIQAFITFLWDLQLNIGHSVRSEEECIIAARDDITIATNLLECRTLEGNRVLRMRLKEGLEKNNVWPSNAFFIAKWEEQRDRHNKHNNTEYNLEPHIKNAPGGLRDIQTIGWVAKRYFGVTTLRELVDKEGFLSEDEYNILLRGEEVLWQIRYGLHMLNNKEEDRLLFEHQQQLAEELGYRDNEERLAVEQFMRHYYRAVLALRELNDVLLHFLDETILRAGEQTTITPINERFQICNDYIEVTNEDVFRENPYALMEVFVLMGHHGEIKGIRASTIRLIRESRNFIDDGFRRDPFINQLFLQLMRSPSGLMKNLKRMKRYGVLGRYLPEFGRIIGQMQHDLFHIYTVDAHTLLVVYNIRRFLHTDSEEAFPIAAHIMRRLPKPELLLIAGLYHDIGKGRGGDHSKLGAVDALAFCQRHNLSTKDANLVAWLVEKHLLMSTISQRHDISDPEVIYNFALEVGDQHHLDYLYALTVADVNATNPNLWTSWKASLMRQLYNETKRALRRGLEQPVDKQNWIEDTQQAAQARLMEKGFGERQIKDLWQGYSEDYFLRENYTDVIWHTEAILEHNLALDQESPLILIREPNTRGLEGATQIFILAKDQPNLFAAMVTALDHLNLDIQDARLYSVMKNVICQTFYVLDENGESIGEDPKIHLRIKQALLTEIQQLSAEDYPAIVQRRTPRQLKYFSNPTRTSVSSDINTGTTVLEVITNDRPGLLARIALVFMEFNIRLHNARIATLGERVEDAFFITDQNGEPLSDPDFCRQLEEAICKQLDENQGQQDNASTISI